MIFRAVSPTFFMRPTSNSTGDHCVPGAPTQGAGSSGKKHPAREVLMTGLILEIN
jgi:hypothetical protein